MAPNGPAIILVVPQMGENIGASARAMFNFGLTDLRLVRPRDGWPNPDAVPMASGARHVVQDAQVFASTAEAIADLNYVAATTARARDMIKPLLTSRDAAVAMRGHEAQGAKTGILFGGERSGLSNDDIVLADAIVQIPTSEQFSSINLAQAVLLTSYEWFVAGPATSEDSTDAGEPAGTAVPALKKDVIDMIEHFERELDVRGFFYPPEKKPSMMRNLRNIWQRADLRIQDVRTLRGVISTLVSGKRKLDKND